MLSGGEAFGLAARFIRNIIVANIVTRADMGIGVTFAMVVTFLEMFSNFGFEAMIVQAKDGDDPKIQKMCHMLVALRGLIIAIIIFLGAPLITMWWEIEETTWAFRWLALIPLIRGFVHMDNFRLQREFNFIPFAACRSIPYIIVTLAAYPIAIWLNDYHVLLVLSISDVVLYVLVSHIMAKRKYAMGWDHEVLMRYLKFGWPLIGGAGLLWLTFSSNPSTPRTY